MIACLSRPCLRQSLQHARPGRWAATHGYPGLVPLQSNWPRPPALRRLFCFAGLSCSPLWASGCGGALRQSADDCPAVGISSRSHQTQPTNRPVAGMSDRRAWPRGNRNGIAKHAGGMGSPRPRARHRAATGRVDLTHSAFRNLAMGFAKSPNWSFTDNHMWLNMNYPAPLQLIQLRSGLHFEILTDRMATWPVNTSNKRS